MKRIATTALIATAAMLAACSQNAQDQTAQAGNAVGADISATTSNAVSDVDAATDSALGSAEATFDNAGTNIERGADRAGQSIENGTDRAAHAAGEALTDAGNSLKH